MMTLLKSAFRLHKLLYTAVLLFAGNTAVQAQGEKGGAAEDALPWLRTASSPKGNYLYFYGTETGAADSNTYKATDYFIVERTTYDTSKQGTKMPALRTIGEARAATTMRQLNTYFSGEELAQLVQVTGVAGPEALPAFIDVHRNPRPYFVGYSTLRMKLALGHMFLDESAKPGTLYYYQVTRVGKDGSRKLWGRAFQMAKLQNAALLQYRPQAAGTRVNDSSIYFTFKLPLRNSIYEPRQPKNISFAFNDEALLVGSGLWNRFYILKNGAFLKPRLQMGALNATADTLTYNLFLNTLPEDELSVWTVAEDLVGNQGPTSDTAFAVALNYNNAPIITRLNVQPIVDGLHLSWPPLPLKPYLRGIRIMRYNSADTLEEVAMLPPTDTAYDDYALVLGNHYRYQVFAEFARGITFVQPVGAQGVGTYQLFSKPLPPENLKAENEGPHIALSWSDAAARGFFGYYVYRGYDGTPLTLLAGPITTTSFLDTATVLNGKSVYTYAIATQNLKQDTSLLSKTVSIRPLRPVAMVAPVSLTTYYTNGRLRLSWEDARKRDAYIAGYQLQKRSGDGKFSNLGGIQTENEAADSALSPGVDYAYRVAAVGPDGELGTYSPATDFRLAPVRDFSTVTLEARSVDNGVALRWTGAEGASLEGYIVFRRLATETEFTPIGRIPKGTLVYTDAKAQAGGRYVYAVAPGFANGVEGIKSDARSITYEPQPKAEVLN